MIWRWIEKLSNKSYKQINQGYYKANMFRTEPFGEPLPYENGSRRPSLYLLIHENLVTYSSYIGV